MKVDTSNIKDLNSSTNKSFAKEQAKKKMAINENYQVFLSIIFFIIGFSFLFYLFFFVFSIYVSHINYFF